MTQTAESVNPALPTKKKITHEERMVKEWPEGHHPLETSWTLWCEKKLHIQQSTEEYLQGLKELGTFSTLEQFYRYWSHLRKASEVPNSYNLSLFRKGIRPMWEDVPYGGTWILKVNRHGHESVVDYIWERLVFGCIGELFGLKELVGVVLSSKGKDIAFSVWNDCNENPRVKGYIGERLREICGLDMHTVIQYKDNMQCMKDMSSYKNAKYYMFTPTSAPLDAPHVAASPLIEVDASVSSSLCMKPSASPFGFPHGHPHHHHGRQYLSNSHKEMFPPLPEAEMEEEKEKEEPEEEQGGEEEEEEEGENE